MSEISGLSKPVRAGSSSLIGRDPHGRREHICKPAKKSISEPAILVFRQKHNSEDSSECKVSHPGVRNPKRVVVFMHSSPSTHSPETPPIRAYSSDFL